MAYTIVVTPKAAKDIRALESVIRNRLGKKLKDVATTHNIHTVAKKLTESTIDDYRLRIGDYRVVFDLDGKKMVLLRVQHRKDVYR